MDINKMMKQAQAMQAKVMQAQEQLEAQEFEHDVNGALNIKVNGKKEVLSINVDEDLLEKDNKEVLEDMLLVAFNTLFKQVDEVTEASMSKATGNMKLPGM